MSRRAQHAAIRARAERAIRALYHNATLPCFPELYGRTDDEAQSWLESVCEFEIEYIRDGGSTPGDYRACLAAPCNAGKYHSEAARAYYVRKGMRDRDLERADCGMMTGWRALEIAAGNKPLARMLKKHNAGKLFGRNDALWERITEYGELYQYGRGGRTLAPANLWRENGCGHGPMVDYCVDRPISAAVRLIQVVESFNAYVGAWCDSTPEQWREHCADQDREKAYEKKQAAIRKAKETRERQHWACRDVATIGGINA